MQNCPDCFGKKWLAKIDQKTGVQMQDEEGNLLWRCWRCGHVTIETSPRLIPMNVRKDSSVLYIDLEVSLSLYWNYGAKVPSKYLSPENIEREYFIISWAASYMHQSKVYSACVTPDEARDGNDKNILAQLHDLMRSADIWAGHNIDNFDKKRVNTRFLKNGFPVLEKKTFDTLKIARSKLALESNTLDYIERWLGLRPKDDISREDWLKIVRDADEKTLAKILKYNKGDVTQGKEILKTFQAFSGKKADYGSVSIL